MLSEIGMGEPMDNYPSVLTALKTLHSAFYIHPAKVTVSTVGVVSSLMKLGRDAPDVNLAFSLHAPNQEVRLTLVPSARVYPLDRLMAAMNEYQTLTGKSIMIEYIVIKVAQLYDFTLWRPSC
jgi:adenine C2-methylase RlmN of 23S rRNA A2503 and tRNA A37